MARSARVRAFVNDLRENESQFADLFMAYVRDAGIKASIQKYILVGYKLKFPRQQCLPFTTLLAS